MYGVCLLLRKNFENNKQTIHRESENLKKNFWKNVNTYFPRDFQLFCFNILLCGYGTVCYFMSTIPLLHMCTKKTPFPYIIFNVCLLGIRMCMRGCVECWDRFRQNCIVILSTGFEIFFAHKQWWNICLEVNHMNKFVILTH